MPGGRPRASGGGWQVLVAVRAGGRQPTVEQTVKFRPQADRRTVVATADRVRVTPSEKLCDLRFFGHKLVPVPRRCAIGPL